MHARLTSTRTNKKGRNTHEQKYKCKHPFPGRVLLWSDLWKRLFELNKKKYTTPKYDKPVSAAALLRLLHPWCEEKVCTRKPKYFNNPPRTPATLPHTRSRESAQSTENTSNMFSLQLHRFRVRRVARRLWQVLCFAFGVQEQCSKSRHWVGIEQRCRFLIDIY